MAVVLTAALLIDFEVGSETASDEEVMETIINGREAIDIRNSIIRKIERSIRLSDHFDVSPSVGWVDDNREILLGGIVTSRVKAMGRKK